MPILLDLVGQTETIGDRRPCILSGPIDDFHGKLRLEENITTSTATVNLGCIYYGLWMRQCHEEMSFEKGDHNIFIL